jgi:CheY-like chemotaxis protein
MARKRLQGSPSGYTILVVDDQEETLASLKLVLEREGHRVLLADSAQRALELFGRQHVNLLLVDYFMPRMTGEELIREIRKVDAEIQIVLQTGYAGEKPPREMLHQLDIQGYHDKTDGPDKLLIWVDVALKAHEQLRRVREMEIMNLLSNAVKFTTAGTITVSAATGDGRLAIAIRDTGIGIAPEDHERIFETFRQLDGGDTRTRGGIGTGLSIAHKLARLMGGDITVDSEPGAGATFTIHLPLAKASVPAADATAATITATLAAGA